MGGSDSFQSLRRDFRGDGFVIVRFSLDLPRLITPMLSSFFLAFLAAARSLTSLSQSFMKSASEMLEVPLQSQKNLLRQIWLRVSRSGWWSEQVGLTFNCLQFRSSSKCTPLRYPQIGWKYFPHCQAHYSFMPPSLVQKSQVPVDSSFSTMASKILFLEKAGLNSMRQSVTSTMPNRTRQVIWQKCPLICFMGKLGLLHIWQAGLRICPLFFLTKAHTSQQNLSWVICSRPQQAWWKLVLQSSQQTTRFLASLSVQKHILQSVSNSPFSCSIFEFGFLRCSSFMLCSFHFARDCASSNISQVLSPWPRLKQSSTYAIRNCLWMSAISQSYSLGSDTYIIRPRTSSHLLRLASFCCFSSCSHSFISISISFPS